MCAALLCVPLTAAAQGAKVRPEIDVAADSDKDHPVERRQWFRQGRTVPGKSAAELLQRAYTQKKLVRAAASSAILGRAAAVSVPNWQNLGPNPLNSDPTGVQSYGAVSGRTTSIAIDQNDLSGNTVYAGGAYGGVWKSSNATAAPPSVVWTPLLDGQSTLAVGAIALKPDTTGSSTVVLVGTGEPDDSGDSYYGLGIMRSADGGASWQVIGSDTLGHSFKGLGFARIAFNSSAGNTGQVVAAASNMTNGFTVGANPGSPPSLYYSTDAGQSWTLSLVTDDGANQINATSATDVVFDGHNGQFYALVRRHGMYASSDGGKTFQRLANQPGPELDASACPASGSFGCPIFRGHMSVQPATGELFVAYMSIDGNGVETLQGVFRSKDGGASWSGDLGQTGYSNCGDVAGCGASQSVYNFYLSAVPHGAGTELYLGGVNIFRCTLPVGGASCAWANLTHVYGCNPISAASHVHPDQHAMAFHAANPQLLYFVNDGGVYRSSNGAASDGTCSANNANSWQNLNSTLGSMGEFVWFSHDVNDENIVLGGTQDNGSPAWTDGAWGAVNSGDGGYNEIDPSNSSVWYTSNFFLSIQRCSAGASCDTPAFATVIDNQKAAGDASSFYAPYMLDPRDPRKMIAATCRVWRGAADGTGWPGTNNSNALSFNLDAASDSQCSSLNTMISALAAGGPATLSGASSVIYAGRENGTIFVSTASDGGPASFVDRSATLLSGHYKIGSIAMDANDTSGNTALAAVMGFGVGHVWRTTDAGQNWANISGNLPDAPADSVLVDPVNPNHIFVGTDAGIFETRDTGATWSDMGGGLPNVPATRLLLFDGQGVRKLRASTYGRGIWEISLQAVPFFTLQMAPGVDAAASIAGSQPATFNLLLSPANGFSGMVSLNCSGAPAGGSCTISPGSISLAANSPGVPVSVTVTTAQHASVIGVPFSGWPAIFAAMLPCLFTVAHRFGRYSARRPQWAFVPVAVLGLVLMLGMVSCGGGSGSATAQTAATPAAPVSSSIVVVTATSGNVSRNVSLTVNTR
jgi:photosystem II stability/assembly factor-like uncharacterized protein